MTVNELISKMKEMYFDCLDEPITFLWCDENENCGELNFLDCAASFYNGKWHPELSFIKPLDTYQE